MDSIDTLLAIQLPLSDSESSSSTSSSSSNNETDAEDNINNEDDQVDVGSDDDDDDGSEVIYADVMNSAGSTPRYGAIADTIGAAAPQSSTQQRPLALTYSTTQSSAAAPPSSSAATTSRFVPAASSAATAAAAAAKGPPTPVIVTASPMAVLGPVSLRPPQTEYEPAASVAATRLSAQYTDSLRRRAETLIQKRLRMQRESVQKLKDVRQLTSRLSELNARLADELVQQRRLVADYDRVRETAQRALGVLRIVGDADAVLADTKDHLLAVLAQRDESSRLPPATQHAQPPQQPRAPAPDTRDDDNDDEHQIPAAAK